MVAFLAESRVAVVNNHPLQGRVGSVISATDDEVRVRIDGGPLRGVSLPKAAVKPLTEKPGSSPIVYGNHPHCHPTARVLNIGRFYRPEEAGLIGTDQEIDDDSIISTEPIPGHDDDPIVEPGGGEDLPDDFGGDIIGGGEQRP